MQNFKYFNDTMTNIIQWCIENNASHERSGNYVYIYDGNGYSKCWVHTNNTSANADLILYGLGWRRELKKEEIETWIKGLHHTYRGLMFTDWLNDKWQEEQFKSDFRLFRSYINKTFNTRNRISLLKNGKVALTKYIITYTEYVDGEFIEREVTSPVPDSLSYAYMGTQPIYYDYSTVSCYYIDNTYLPIFKIIVEDIQECPDHPGELYMPDGVCRLCAEKYKIHSYSTNALDFFEFRKLDKEKNPVYLGVELEFDTEPRLLKNALEKHTHHMIAKHDGSILGFELVTAPATYAIHKQEFETFPFEKQVVSYRDGMHIHIDKKALTTMQIGKMFEFMYTQENIELLKVIAGRGLGTYCSTTSGVKSLLSTLKEHEGGLEYRVEGSHGTALNVSGKSTIEVRIFRTPETYGEFMSRLQFVKALIEWTAPGAVDYGVKGFKDANNFLNFVTEGRKSYPNLFNSII
jgi:hypothetical protein